MFQDHFVALRNWFRGCYWPGNGPPLDWLVVEDARRILGEYIEPGPRDATQTVERLLAALDSDDFIRALDRMNRRRILRLVE
jgi:hypothetical protein